MIHFTEMAKSKIMILNYDKTTDWNTKHKLSDSQ